MIHLLPKPNESEDPSLAAFLERTPAAVLLDRKSVRKGRTQGGSSARCCRRR